MTLQEEYHQLELAVVAFAYLGGRETSGLPGKFS